MAASFPTGGPASPATVWLTLLPVLAVVLLGRRWGVVWGAIGTLAYGLLWAVPMLTGRPSTLEIGPEFLPAFGMTVFTAVMLLHVGISSMYEAIRVHMVSELETAQDAVREAHEQARVVLDNVDQGLFLVDRAGRLLGEQQSAAVESWFGTPTKGRTFWSWIESTDANAATWLELGWEDVTAGFLPPVIVLEQIPRHVSVGDRTVELSFTPLGSDPDTFDRMLIVATDITQKLAAERAEQGQRELVAVLQAIGRDRRGFMEFFREASRLVRSLRAGGDDRDAFRWIHTLKGNASFYGLSTVGEVCHRIESAMVEARRGPTDAERAEVAAVWDTMEGRLAPLIGDRSVIPVPRRRLLDVASIAQTGAPGPEIASLLRSFAMEPLAARFSRVAEQTSRLAARLGKGDIDVVVRDRGLSFDPEALADFWSNFTHAVRNAVDHGLETPEERQQAGKAPQGRITLEATHSDEGLEVALIDDGRGVAWDRVRAKAEKLGLPASTRDDLVDALFADGLSTRDAATSVSGRGVGMPALKASVVQLGGRIEVHSEAGRGTTFRFVLPLAEQRVAA